jgi:hypothetical protein
MEKVLISKLEIMPCKGMIFFQNSMPFWKISIIPVKKNFSHRVYFTELIFRLIQNMSNNEIPVIKTKAKKTLIQKPEEKSLIPSI